MALYTYCNPHLFHQHIKDIEYDKLLKQGKTTLFFDLDNTVMSYDQTEIDEEMLVFLRTLEKNFKIVIVSNSGYKRVSFACEPHAIPFIHSAKKPFKRGFKRALQKASSTVSESVFIGDQLMTDVLGSNKMGMTSILVFPLKKRSDHVFTRINRRLEKYMIKKIKTHDLKSYNNTLKAYVETKQT
jgi:HAD superfamily phosphatase (TIGR01668 family)